MFLYQIRNEEITVFGCRSYGGLVELPEVIDGRPVTELSAYAFSEGGGRRGIEKAAGKLLPADSGGNAVNDGYAFMEPMAGCGQLKEITLPPTVKKIGNYAFYNCFGLETIRCHSTIEDVGSGLFTGCGSVAHLDIHIVPGRCSCFKELISELREELYVNYYVEPASEARGKPEGATDRKEVKDGFPGAESSGLARLVFPEMFEESVENTPARIISQEMHGCGQKYRYCFEQTDFRFSKYDALFPHIKVQEPEKTVSALVMGRLKYPMELMARYRAPYEEYLRGHMEAAAARALEDRDTELYSWLAVNYGDRKETLDMMLELANRKGETETLSGLMDLRRRRFPSNKRTFSL